MAKSRIADEVQVFRFFDEAPLEKAETVFKLVTERMRSRMGVSGPSHSPSKRSRGAALHPQPGPVADP